MPTSRTCIDSNCAVRLVASTDGDPVRGLWERWMVEGRQFVAPSLFRYEVTNTLYRYHHAGVRTPEATSILLAAALALPIEQLVAPGLHQAAVRFATRFRLPAAYDAHYLALADHLGCEFWTGDRKLVKTIGTSLPWVRLVDVIPRNSTDSAG